MPSNIDKKTVEGETQVRLCNYTDVYYNERIVLGPDYMLASATYDQISKFNLRLGDVIITKDSEEPDDIGIPACVYETAPDLVCGYHLAILRPYDPTLGPFIARSVSSGASKAHFFVSAKGVTRYALGYYAIADMPILLPPSDEALAVVAYIDAAVMEIDSAISSQERMVELLKERRSVIITHAVTKGLDTRAKMKDSGVPWLGQVPAHWEVKGLKFLLSANQGGAWGDEPTGLGDTIVLRSTEQTQTGEWRIEDPEARNLSETERKKTLLKKGDILVTKASGSEAHIGKASLVDDAVASLNAGYSNFMQRLRARPGIEPQLILFMLNSKAVRDQFVYLSNSTSGLGNISAWILNNVLVAEPPESEQFGIVDHIAKECRGIDSAINKVERMIELLKERRSALITQAVTGQIDVR